MKTVKTLIHFAILGLFFQSLGMYSVAAEFEVDGVMTGKPVPYPFSRKLQVYVHDGEWAIFSIDDNAPNRMVDELSDDGSSIYKIDRLETNTGSFLPDDYSRVVPGNATGEIHRASFPFQIHQPEAITLFYAYASTSYLDEHTNQIIGSISFQRDGVPDMGEGDYAMIKRSASPLRLPNAIIFLAPIEDRTNAILECSSFTNIAGMQIPLKVSLSCFYPGNTNILAYEFQVTKIVDKCVLQSFKPILPGGSYVTDYRVPHFYANQPGSSHRMTNGWPVLAR